MIFLPFKALSFHVFANFRRNFVQRLPSQLAKQLLLVASVFNNVWQELSVIVSVPFKLLFETFPTNIALYDICSSRHFVSGHIAKDFIVGLQFQVLVLGEKLTKGCHDKWNMRSGLEMDQ